MDVTADTVKNGHGRNGNYPPHVPRPVRNPQSDGMTESFVQTIKVDYVANMPKPYRGTALRNFAITFEYYNEGHPHNALKYRTPR